MVRIDRVTTKRGDDGSTDLASGERAPKDSLRVEAFGAVDETNAAVGLAREILSGKPKSEGRDRIEALLVRAQNELFDLGSDLSTTPGKHYPEQPRIEPTQVGQLEEAIRELNAGLPILTSFVLPGGGILGATLHLARTVARRAERAAWRLSRQEPVSQVSLVYLNRLSDLLFVLARFSAHLYGEPEPLWEPDKNR